MNTALKRLKPWLGFMALIILGYAFYTIQRDHELNLTLPKGLKEQVLLFSCILLAPFFKILTWHQITRALDISVPFSKTFHACLLSIAGRYIPGKILFVIGRIHVYGPNQKRMGIASLGLILEFMIENLAGFFLLIVACSFSIFSTPHQQEALLITGFFIFILFFPPVYRWLFNKLPTRWAPEIPASMSLPTLILGPLCLTLLHWACYLTSIWILSQSFIQLEFKQVFGLGVGAWLGGTLGTLAIFMPGGLGVRESVTTFILIQMAISPEIAFSIAITARLSLWAGEISLSLLFWGLRLGQFTMKRLQS